MEKYVVFKKEEYENRLDPQPLDDAVVIRRQDIFAPPALDAYANAIQTAIEVMSSGTQNYATIQLSAIEGLRGIADYFSDQAAKAWAEQRKLPD